MRALVLLLALGGIGCSLAKGEPPQPLGVAGTESVGIVPSQSRAHFALYRPDVGHIRGKVSLFALAGGMPCEIWPDEVFEEMSVAAKESIAEVQGRLLGEWSIDPYPFMLWVLDRPPSVLLWQGERPLPDGEWLAMIDASGDLRWRHSVEDLFGVGGQLEFEFGVHRLVWLDRLEVLEGRGQIIVHARGGEVRSIDIGTGTVRKGL